MTESIFKKFDMTGKTAIITGAAGLLGKQFCLALAQVGANVVMADLEKSLFSKTRLNSGKWVSTPWHWKSM